MEITLSPEVEAAVRSKVDAGHYASVEDYVLDAIEALEEREEWVTGALDKEREKLELSLQQAARGELMDGDQVKIEMQAMKAEWMRTNRHL